MKYNHFKPLETSEIVSLGVNIYLSDIFKIVLPYLIFGVFSALIESTITNLLALYITPWPPHMGLAISYVSLLISSFISLLITSILLVIAVGMTVVIVSEKFRGSEITFSEAFSRSVNRLPSLLGGIIVSNIIIMIGLILLIIPGIIFAVWLSLVPQVILLENKPALSSIERSKNLVSSYWWKVFVILIITLLFVYLPILLFQFIVSFIFPPMIITPSFRIVVSVITMFFSSLFYPILPSVFTVLFYDLKIREKPDMVIEDSKIEVHEKQSNVETLTHKRYCPYCGSPVPTDALFCPNCGASLDEEE
ncbi:MAG: zinc ribbon domain-containing protein [Candidatus Odinarchaeia archaeon]